MIPKACVPLLIAASLILGSCKKEEHVATDSSQTGTTTATGTVTSTLATTAVTVTFEGMVAHLFADQFGEKDRAVVLADKSDHPVYLTVPAEINKAKLEAVTGLTASGPTSNRYEVGPVEGFSIRVVGWDTAKNRLASLMHKPLVPGTTFDERAPHLLTEVSENELKHTELKASLFDPVPDKSDWAIFFALDGGTLEADPACVKSTFDHTTSQPARDFASRVVLTGQVDGEPVIQFLKKDGFWETVPFDRPPTGTTLAIKATFVGTPTKSHFKMFKKLANSNVKFHDVVFEPCPGSGVDPACTNSQWP